MGFCGAKIWSGSPCQLPAGWGTGKGKGRCKLHGGLSTGPKDARGNKTAVKYWMYEKVVHERLTPEEQALFDAVPADVDLTQELKILCFKLYRLLEPVSSGARTCP